MAEKPAACQLCSSLDLVDMFLIDQIQLKRCRHCGLVFVFPLPADEELRTGYQQKYFQSGDPLHWGYENYLAMDGENRQTAERRLGILTGFLRGGSLLEVGCATGLFMQAAQAKGFAAKGVEISDFAAAHGRENYKLDIFTGILRDARFADASFDAVAMWDVLEHVPAPLRDLEEVARVLKSGGYLFLTVPNINSFWARIMGKNWFGFTKIREHLFYYNRRTITQALSQSGFNVVRIKSSPFLVTLKFLSDKMGRYSRLLSGWSGKVLKVCRLENKKVNFQYIDMLVVARKR